MEFYSKSTGYKKKRDEEKEKSKKDDSKDNSEEEESDIIKTKDEIAIKLDDKKRITVRKFKGKLLVDIREFYNDKGEMKPGKKGIALSKEKFIIENYPNVLHKNMLNNNSLPNLEFCARYRKQALNTGCMIRRGLQ